MLRQNLLSFLFLLFLSRSLFHLLRLHKITLLQTHPCRFTAEVHFTAGVGGGRGGGEGGFVTLLRYTSERFSHLKVVSTLEITASLESADILIPSLGSCSLMLLIHYKTRGMALLIWVALFSLVRHVFVSGVPLALQYFSSFLLGQSPRFYLPYQGFYLLRYRTLILHQQWVLLLTWASFFSKSLVSACCYSGEHRFLWFSAVPI